MNDVRELIIIGGACAGLTAAVYASRANLHPLCIEGFEAGGQLMITSDVENYPGFPEGVLGPDLMVRFREQAERFGTEFITDDVTSVDFSERPFRVSVGAQEYRARAVILAMGAEPRKLGVLGEEELAARGISYCATCDAAFYRSRKVIVMGGGDSAMEEAIFLSKFASTVTIVHRRDEFRASAIMLQRAREIENIEFLTPYAAERFEPGDDGALGKAVLRHSETGEQLDVEIDGVFVGIGHKPTSRIVEGQVPLDEDGYV